MYRAHRGILSCAGSGLKNRVSRMSPAAWYQPGVGVTGTLTASNWADQSGNGRDLAQGTAGNQPIYLPYSGTPYAYLPGVAANNFSTPDSAANSITGDITVDCKIALNDWTPAAYSAFVSKRTTGCWQLYIDQLSTGKPVFIWWQADGTLRTATSTAATGVTDVAIKWVRVTLDVDNGASGCDTKFWLSDDGETWTQLGSTVTQAFITNIRDNADPVRVGCGTGGSSDELVGKVYRARIYSGIGVSAVLVNDFDPSIFAETSTNGTTATASTGEVWTLNSTGAKPATVVKSSKVLFDGVVQMLATASFAVAQPMTMYAVLSMPTWADTKHLISCGTVDTFVLQQLTSSPNIRFFGGSGTTLVSGLSINEKGIVTIVGNGASTIIQVNQETAGTGTDTNGIAAGLVVGERVGTGQYANLMLTELIVFSAAHTAAERSVVQNYLAATHRIAL